MLYDFSGSPMVSQLRDLALTSSRQPWTDVRGYRMTLQQGESPFGTTSVGSVVQSVWDREGAYRITLTMMILPFMTKKFLRTMEQQLVTLPPLMFLNITRIHSVSSVKAPWCHELFCCPVDTSIMVSVLTVLNKPLAAPLAAAPLMPESLLLSRFYAFAFPLTITQLCKILYCWLHALKLSINGTIY